MTDQTKLDEFERLGGDASMLADLVLGQEQADQERAQAVAYKADPPAAEPEPEPEAEPETEEDTEEGEEIGDDTTLTEGDLIAVKALLGGMLEPVLNVFAKLEREMTAQKAATPDPRIAALEARLAALEGLSPKSAGRPSQDPANVAIAESLKGKQPAEDPFAVHLSALFGPNQG